MPSLSTFIFAILQPGGRRSNCELLAKLRRSPSCDLSALRQADISLPPGASCMLSTEMRGKVYVTAVDWG